MKTLTFEVPDWATPNWTVRCSECGETWWDYSMENWFEIADMISSTDEDTGGGGWYIEEEVAICSECLRKEKYKEEWVAKDLEQYCGMTDEEAEEEAEEAWEGMRYWEEKKEREEGGLDA